MHGRIALLKEEACYLCVGIPMSQGECSLLTSQCFQPNRNQAPAREKLWVRGNVAGWM